MPLAKPLSTLRQELREILLEDLPAALQALRELLPEQSDKHGQVLALSARLKEINKERLRNTLSMDEYLRKVDTLRAACFDLLGDLEEGDFEEGGREERGGEAASAKASAAKQGSVLYRVPHRMPLQKPTICTVRVAVDSDALLDDITLDDDVRLRERVEVSDMMRAELLDPGGEVFAIRLLNDPEQLVRPAGYTQWLFSVTPRLPGEHQLMVKISMLEYVPNLGRFVPRDVSVLETVTIVTEPGPATEEEETFKATGHTLALKSGAPEAAAHKPARPLFSKLAGSLRAIAFFFIFLLLSTTATVWAAVPDFKRDHFITRVFNDTAEGNDQFAKKYKNKPEAAAYVEEAVFRKADITEALTDLRDYQHTYHQEGRFAEKVAEKIDALEVKALTGIQQRPGIQSIRQFVTDFPESGRLPQLKQVADAHPELREEVLPVLENAYLRSLQVQPSAKKVELILRDFPQSERLPEVAAVLEERPDIAQQVQPLVDAAAAANVKNAERPDQVQAVLPLLEAAGSSAGVKQVEQAVAAKPRLKARLQPLLRQTALSVQRREAAQGIAPQRVETAGPDADGDGMPDKIDGCPNDKNKTASGDCGCGTPDKDSDGDGTADCKDGCPNDKNKTAPGDCGCGMPDKDSDGDGTADCKDGCPNDKTKTTPGDCGCGTPDKDSDGDGVADCKDDCPTAKGPARWQGCPDTDGDGISDQNDKCPREKGIAAQEGCPAVAPLKENPAPDFMILVQGGTFDMGDVLGDGGDEKPVHSVTLSSFYLGKTEVTFDEYDAYCTAVNKGKPSDEGWGRGKRPVINVSWLDAVAYCNWLSEKQGLTKVYTINGNNVTANWNAKGYRLPTEAEWEYVARQRGQNVRFGNGKDMADPAEINFDGSAAYKEPYSLTGEYRRKTTPAGSFKANSLGLHDMSGNVWEWCWDWYGDYSAGVQTDPRGPNSGSSRVRRGGSWLYDPLYARVAYRNDDTPGNRVSFTGFRLARTF